MGKRTSTHEATPFYGAPGWDALRDGQSWIKEGKDGESRHLGNFTSQFFANVYLNKLDWFVKQKLKVKYYIRYVDDFVILNPYHETLELYKQEIGKFLMKKLKLELRPDKSRTIAINRGVGFLGFRVFRYHKLLKKSNTRKITRKLMMVKAEFDSGRISYDKVYSSFEGWLAYARQGNTYKLRTTIIKKFEATFTNHIATVELGRWLKILHNASVCFSSRNVNKKFINCEQIVHKS